MQCYNRGQIICFLKVAETNSFSQAAHGLFLTPTAVSKQIKNLELIIGEQLFLRTTRTVQLTEFGTLFYQRCKPVEEQINAINQFIESNREVPQGSLKLLVSTITSKAWILEHLAAFMNTYPLLELEINFSEEDSALAQPDIDIMVGFPVIPLVTEPLKYKKMFGLNNILCASQKFVALYGKPETAEELPQYKIISHTLRKPAHFLHLADGQQLHCAKPLLYMNNFDALHQACREGIGMFLTGDTLVKPWLDSGEFIQLLPQYTFKHHDIFMFYRAYDYEIPKIRVFLEYFTQYASF